MTLASLSPDALRILLIEDSKSSAVSIQKAITDVMPKASCMCAYTLEEALSMLAEKEFDVALLDRSLPDAQEFMGLSSLHNMAPTLPVVFLTGYKDEKTALEAIKQGAQDYLFKDNLEGHLIKRAIQFAVLRKEFEGVLMLRANFDTLTGLSNRMTYENRLDIALSRCARHGSNVAIFFLDLNKFKQINDTLGHAAGDILLQEAAHRLRSLMRPYDLVSRYGGDEFAVLVEDLVDIDHAETVAKKIIHFFEAPFQINDTTVSIGVSIGVVCCISGQQCSREQVMKQADTAMYQAKKSSISTYCLYHDKVDWS